MQAMMGKGIRRDRVLYAQSKMANKRILDSNRRIMHHKIFLLKPLFVLFCCS